MPLSQGSMFPGTAGTKVPAANNYITGLHFTGKIICYILHAMSGQFLWIRGIEITGRDYDICIHIITIFKYFTFSFIRQPPLDE